MQNSDVYQCRDKVESQPILDAGIGSRLKMSASAGLDAAMDGWRFGHSVSLIDPAKKRMYNNQSCQVRDVVSKRSILDIRIVLKPT